MQPAFDSFNQQMDYDEWAPLVRRLEEASNDNPERLSQELSEFPKIRHYRLFGMIGRGAMAKVFGAWDVIHSRPVAIKLFEPKHEEVWSLIRRFQNEADALGTLESPHIVSLLDRGNKRGRVYLVMNLIVGPSLTELIQYWKRENGQLDDALETRNLLASSKCAARSDSSSTLLAVRPQRTIKGRTPSLPGRMAATKPMSDDHFRIVAEIGRDVCEALQCSHQKGILHRDLKPSNLLIDQRGKVWITDFGLANLDWRSDLDAAEQRITQCGDLLGTIAYMSVGAVDGNYSCQSDLYSLGVTLYELATLKPIWNGQSDNEILRDLFDQAPPPLIDWRLDSVPMELAKIINALLNAELSPNPPNATQLHHAFAAWVDGEPVVLPQGTSGMGVRTLRFLRRRKKLRSPKTLLLIWALLVSSFAAVMGVKRYGEHALDKAMADSIHATAQEKINQAVDSIHLLKQFTQNVPSIDEASFASLANPMLNHRSEVLTIKLAQVTEGDRDVTVTQVEPRTLRDQALGTSMLSDPRRREAIKKTEFTSGVAVASPIQFLDQELERQGFALLLRVDRPNEPTSFVEVLIRFDDIMKQLNLPNYDQRMFVRVQPESLLSTEPIFEGDQHGVQFQIPAFDPEFEYQLNIGSNHWNLMVSRANPWQRSQASWILSTGLFAIALSLPLLLLGRIRRSSRRS